MRIIDKFVLTFKTINKSLKCIFTKLETITKKLAADTFHLKFNQIYFICIPIRRHN